MVLVWGFWYLGTSGFSGVSVAVWDALKCCSVAHSLGNPRWDSLMSRIFYMAKIRWFDWSGGVKTCENPLWLLKNSEPLARCLRSCWIMARISIDSGLITPPLLLNLWILCVESVLCIAGLHATSCTSHWYQFFLQITKMPVKSLILVLEWVDGFEGKLYAKATGNPLFSGKDNISRGEHLQHLPPALPDDLWIDWWLGLFTDIPLTYIYTLGTGILELHELRIRSYPSSIIMNDGGFSHDSCTTWWVSMGPYGFLADFPTFFFPHRTDSAIEHRFLHSAEEKFSFICSTTAVQATAGPSATQDLIPKVREE